MMTVLPSKTYKLKPPDDISKSALYFTVVGDGIPEAFFINSKAMESFQWIIALMTSYSRQLRAGVPIQKVVDAMKGTFDPHGKYIIEDGSGREVHSVVHHLGLVLEKHISENTTI